MYTNLYVKEKNIKCRPGGKKPHKRRAPLAHLIKHPPEPSESARAYGLWAGGFIFEVSARQVQLDACGANPNARTGIFSLRQFAAASSVVH